jgi:ERCC4-type nuclease
MESYTKEELSEALRAIASMISKTEKAKGNFTEGTSQHTLQKNRLNALNVALSLVTKELADNAELAYYTKEDLKKALAPIASLISKSEKARNKLAQGTWQHTMLGSNLKALHIASPLLTKALEEPN